MVWIYASRRNNDPAAHFHEHKSMYAHACRGGAQVMAMASHGFKTAEEGWEDALQVWDNNGDGLIQASAMVEDVVVFVLVRLG